MLPIVLDITSQKLVVIGAGALFERRLALVRASGAKDILINPDSIPKGAVVFIAGLDAAQSEAKAQEARAVGALVNTEDILPLCDFHMPALVRRGDLLFTVSTGGRSPALARVLRQDLEKHYGEEWAERLDKIAAKRSEWRIEGKTPSEVSHAAQKMIEDERWLR